MTVLQKRIAMAGCVLASAMTVMCVCIFNSRGPDGQYPTDPGIPPMEEQLAAVHEFTNINGGDPDCPHEFKTEYKMDGQCMKQGYEHQVCSLCGAWHDEYDLSAPGHCYDRVVLREGNCLYPEEFVFVCSVCGYEYGHDFGKIEAHDWQDTVILIEKGTQIMEAPGIQCAVCGERKVMGQ